MKKSAPATSPQWARRNVRQEDGRASTGALVTYYTLFVIDLLSRRVHVTGSTPTPDAWFMAQTERRLSDAVDGFLAGYRILICDRDGKWTDGFRRIVEGSGIRIVLTPVRAPPPTSLAVTCNAKSRSSLMLFMP